MLPERLRESIRHSVRSRIRYRVTRAGGFFLLALLLVGAGAFYSGNNLLFLIFAAMMALLLVSGFLSRLVLAGLELELLLPRHVFARSPAPARIRVRNIKRHTPSFSIEISGADSFLARPVYLPVIAGNATLEIPVDVVFPRRGRHSENLFLLSTSFPFGFVHRTSPVELIRETLVYPALAADASARAMAEVAGIEAGHLRGSGHEFHRIRPHEPSDEARQVDWKGTARTGTLQVREFTRDRHRRVEIVFDPTISPGQQQAFEELIERCAAVCRHLSLLHNPILFHCEKTITEAVGPEGIYDILILLAMVEPVLVRQESREVVTSPVASAADLPVAGDAPLRIVFSTRPEHLQ